MNEGATSVHEIKLVVEFVPSFGNGGCVAEHTHRTTHRRHVTSGNDCGRLIVDSHLHDNVAYKQGHVMEVKQI